MAAVGSFGDFMYIPMHDCERQCDVGDLFKVVRLINDTRTLISNSNSSSLISCYLIQSTTTQVNIYQNGILNYNYQLLAWIIGVCFIILTNRCHSISKTDSGLSHGNPRKLHNLVYCKNIGTLNYKRRSFASIKVGFYRRMTRREICHHCCVGVLQRAANLSFASRSEQLFHRLPVYGQMSVNRVMINMSSVRIIPPHTISVVQFQFGITFPMFSVGQVAPLYVV